MGTPVILTVIPGTLTAAITAPVAPYVNPLPAELEKRGIPLRLAEARSSVREMLRTEGIEEKVGRINRFTTLADTVDSLRQGEGDSSESTDENLKW